MSLLERYADFSPSRSDVSNLESSNELEFENSRLQAFEEGYKLGWDDAVNAHQQTQSALSQELSEKLQEISFGYHEARNQLSRELSEAMRPALEQLLSTAGNRIITDHIVESVHELSRDSFECTVKIEVPQNLLEETQRRCEDQLKDPFEIVVAPSTDTQSISVTVGTTRATCRRPKNCTAC